MKLKTLAVAVALAAAAPAALAESIDVTVTLLPSAGSFSAAFGASKTQSGLFVDTFTFGLPQPSGSVSVSFDSITPNIDLVVGTLASPDGSSYAQSPPDGIDSFTVLSIADAMGPLTLTLLGAAGDAFAQAPSALTGSYSGTISFMPASAAVPVSGTHALMLAGLVAIGATARRRRATR